MEVKQRAELDALMNDFYGDDRAKAEEARNELMSYGEALIRANQLEDYQDLISACAGVIADKGIDVTPAERGVVEGRAQETSEVPAPIKLMRDFEEQAKKELGELTSGAVAVTQTREIVEKLATTLSRQREIIERIQREPSSIEGFVAAIDKNNALSEKQIGNETQRLQHFREYFPDENDVSTINPENSSYKDSQYDRVQRADMQMQLLADLKTTVEELAEIEKNRQEFQQQYEAGDPDAKANIEACERKAASLKEKIAKVGPDGRETGLIQRLKDYRLAPGLVSKIDIDRAETYKTKLKRIGEVIKEAEADRALAYAEMAKTVEETIEAKGMVDGNSTRYPESKKADLLAKIRNLTGTRDKKDDPDFTELSPEELEASRTALRDYVKYVKDDIQQTQDRIAEFSDAIEFRNQAKDEIEKHREAVRTSEEEARRLRNTPVSNEERQKWLDEEVQIGEGDDARLVVARDQIKAEAQAEAQAAFRNHGRNGFTRFFRNIGFFLSHGFRSRDRMISERAESLVDEKTTDYINERRNGQIQDVEREGRAANSKLAGIETISRAARNDASVHSAAHRAAANITDENILSGSDNSRVNAAETATAKDLSNMGYDLALQKWRNGEMTQSEFDRILKEHLENPDRRDRYAQPDQSKGYTSTPEYRNAADRPSGRGDDGGRE